MKIELGDFQCVYDRVGEGPDLTLLHSVGLSTREGWRYQIPALAEHFRVLSFDFRGLGQSEQGSRRSHVDTFVRDLENLLAALKISQTAVMGISLGGFVAQAFALRRPDALSALVLVSTTCGHLAMNAPSRNERITRVRKLGMAAAADEQLEKQFAPEFAAANPDVLQWYRGHYLANDPLVYADVLEDLGRVSFCDRLHAIKCPTLIVAGDSDRSVVAGEGPLDSPARLKNLISGSNLAVIPDAKHYPQIDHADVFNAVVLDFLRRKVKPKLC
jgi:pimeloyl-ACP methyl ester carboxylesterase